MFILIDRHSRGFRDNVITLYKLWMVLFHSLSVWYQIHNALLIYVPHNGGEVNNQIFTIHTGLMKQNRKKKVALCGAIFVIGFIGSFHLISIYWNKIHDDVIIWKHFPRYWPFVAGNSPVTDEFPAQRPVSRSFDVSLICAWINRRVNNRGVSFVSTINSRYITLQYSTILRIAQQLRRQNICQTSNSRKTPKRRPNELWESFASYFEKSDREISGAHLFFRPEKWSCYKEGWLYLFHA